MMDKAAAADKPEDEHKAYAFAVVGDDDDTMNKRHLSDDDGYPAGEKYPGWKSMPYVIGNETCEKLGTIGTTANLLVYLTTVYGMKSASAATLLNLWDGTVNLAPVLGAFLSDSYLGRYATIVLATVASFVGMILLTLTAAAPSLHPHGGTGPSATQMAVLLVSFALLAVGAGGIRPCNLAFGADQFDPRTPAGRRGINSFFNWYYFTFTVAMMISATVIIYVQSSVSWALGLAVPATLMGLSCVLFLMGTPLYVRVRPEGSPFTSFAQVLVAAARKRRLPAPASPGELFDPPHQSNLITKIAYTDKFVCLDKAAVVTSEDELTAGGTSPANPWRLCTLQQIEEVKCLARLIPVWSSGIVYYIVLTNLGKYNVLQAMQTDRHLGRSGFQIPAGSFVVFNMLALTLWIPVYDRLVVPALQRVTKREGGITHFQRIGTGMVMSIATMLVAAAAERHRRRVGDSASCFVLVPQQVLAGVSEAFVVIGQVDLYYKQFPENMRSVAGAVVSLGFAVASYASGLMVTVVNQRTGRPDWLAEDLDQGRLDLYYLLIAAMAAVNLVYFVACARWYRFKKSDAAAVELEGSNYKAAAPPDVAPGALDLVGVRSSTAGSVDLVGATETAWQQGAERGDGVAQLSPRLVHGRAAADLGVHDGVVGEAERAAAVAARLRGGIEQEAVLDGRGGQHVAAEHSLEVQGWWCLGGERGVELRDGGYGDEDVVALPDQLVSWLVERRPHPLEGASIS